MFFSGIRQAKCEHSSMLDIRQWLRLESGEEVNLYPRFGKQGWAWEKAPIPLPWLTDVLIGYFFSLVFQFYNPISEILYKYDGLNIKMSFNWPWCWISIHSVTMRKHFLKQVIYNFWKQIVKNYQCSFLYRYIQRWTKHKVKNKRLPFQRECLNLFLLIRRICQSLQWMLVSPCRESF